MTLRNDFDPSYHQGTFLDKVREISNFASSCWYTIMCAEDVRWLDDTVLLKMKDVSNGLMMNDLTDLWRDLVVPMSG